MTGRRVAVVGSGMAGLTTAYLLSRADEVTLLEAKGRLGGHAIRTRPRVNRFASGSEWLR